MYFWVYIRFVAQQLIARSLFVIIKCSPQSTGRWDMTFGFGYIFLLGPYGLMGNNSNIYPEFQDTHASPKCGELLCAMQTCPHHQKPPSSYPGTSIPRRKQGYLAFICLLPHSHNIFNPIDRDFPFKTRSGDLKMGPISLEG